MTMLPILLLLAAPDDLAAKARELTRAELPCRSNPNTADITVCGRREADRRFRITHVTTALRDSVPHERSTLLEEKLSDCGRVGMVPRGCGFAGVTMTSGGGTTTIKPRKLAPYSKADSTIIVTPAKGGKVWPEHRALDLIRSC